MSSPAGNDQISIPGSDVDPAAALPGHLPASVLRQLAGEASPAAGGDDLTAAARPATLPLSPGQQRLWYLHEINPASIEYNMQLPLRLTGELDARVLARALNSVVARHESLRTVFGPGAGRGTQIIRPPADVPMPTVDFSAADDREDALSQCLTQDALRPFDLRRGPLLRALLARLGPREHVLVLSVHHVVADGWSMGILMEELRAGYAAQAHESQAEPAPLPLQYADYAIWLEQQPSAALDGHLRYWRGQLAGLRPLDLPADLPRPPVRTGAGAAHAFEIAEPTVSGLRRIASDHRATLFMVLLAAVQVLLARYTGEDDIAVATAVSGRSRVEVENLIGFFVNRLVLRSRLDEEQSFGEFLDDVRLTVLDAFANQEVPFQQLVETLHPERDPSRPPLASVTVNLNGAQQQYAEAAGLLMAELMPPLLVNANDISFDLREHDGQLTGILGYTTDLFTEQTASRMAAALTTLLAGIADGPARPLAELPILEHAESVRLTEAGACDGPPSRSAAELFSDQVARDPAATAVTCGDRALTYDELDVRAGRLARLLADRGVGADDVVAIAMPRSIDLIVALLAVLKAGAAYLPLDLSLPDQRLQFMLQDSRPVLALTTSSAAAKLAQRLPAIVLDDPATIAQLDQGSEPVQVVCGPGHLAYVIYTSGSTGQPKAVLVTQAGVSQLVSAQASGLAAGPAARVLQFASPGFDAAFWETAMSLLSGGTLVLPAGQEPPSGEELARLIADQRITHLTLPPTVLSTLPPGSLASVTTLVVAGEACPPRLVRDWSAGRRMINAYGPTESTVCATMSDPLGAEAAAGASVSIGRSLPGTDTYLLDRRLRPVPVGVPAELYISGAGLARGYLRRPGITAERFVPDPFGLPGSRMYRSGDVLRWRPDGTLEFLGRADGQVKLRGFRIELGEVEAVLADHPDVAIAAADIRRNPAGADQLVAYLTARPAPGPVIAQLREFARKRLPEHMVPTSFVMVSELPLTASGKIDRRALPDPTPAASAEASYVAPRTPAEKVLAATWSELLGVERVGVNDNFFDLGGDSILGLEVVARAREKGLQVIPPHLLTRQTVAELAAEATLTRPAAPEGQPAMGDVPLLPIHRWFFETLADSLSQFNQSVLVELTGDVDWQSLSTAVRALLDQHDVLRLRASRVDGQWREHTADADAADVLTRLDLSGVPEANREDEIDRAIAAAQGDFPLSSGPLVRMLLIEPTAGLPSRLFISVHHLAVDGVSWRILLSDLQRAYQQASGGEEISLGQRTTSYRDWAQRFAEYTAAGGFDSELGYWARAERDCAVAAPLPVDGPGPNEAASRRTVHGRLTAARTAALLQQVLDAYRTGISDVLLSVLGRVLADWTGDRLVGVAIEGHGRADLFEQVDLSRTTGWFTALFPVALTMPAARDWGAVLKAVKEQRRGVPGDGLGYGALRYLRPDTLPGEAKLGSQDEPQVAFNYLGRLDMGLTDGPGLVGRLRPSTVIGLAPGQRRPQLIEVNAMVSPDGELAVEWAYSANVHAEPSMSALATAFTVALEQVIDYCAEPEAGGCTPSDFPLARLDQASVDKIVGNGRAVEDIYPLTPAQGGMLFHSLADSADDMYVGHFSAVIDGLADPAALAAAWQAAADLTPALRTAIVWRGVAEPVQVVYRRIEIPVTHHDLRGLASAAQLAESERYWELCTREQLELHRAPLIKLTMLRLSDTSIRLLWSAHHLILDGWSFASLLPDIFAQYAALTGGDPAAVATVRRPFRDYVAWLARQDHDAAHEHWRQAMAGFSSPVTLPLDRRAPALHRARSTMETDTWLSPEHSQQLLDWARQARVTVNTLVQGAWAILLSRYCGQQDICFGATDSGRAPGLPGADSITGMFIRTLPVRCTVDDDSEIIPWLRDLQEAQAQASEYGYVSLADIQGCSDVPRGATLFDSIVVFENYPHDLAVGAEFGLVMRDYAGAEHNNFALTLTAYSADRLSLSVGYDPDLFDGATIDRMSGHLVALLDAMASGRYGCLRDLAMLAEAERRQLLSLGRGITVDSMPTLCVQEAFARTAALSPGAVAVQDAVASLTFAELDKRANQVAHRLLALGVGPGVLTGICLNRSVDAIVAMLGVLKAGGAFVPADPNYPDLLLQTILADAAPPVLITEQALLERLSSPGGTVLCLDQDQATLERMPADAPVVKADLNDLAYVVYTSGTTGRPKGVMVSHRNIDYLVHAWNARYDLTSLRPRCLSVSSLGVDLFFGDFLLSAFFGGSLVICPSDAVADPSQLVRIIAETRPQVLVTVPLLASAIVEEAGATGSAGAAGDALSSLRLLMVGSEGWKTADCLGVLAGLSPQTRAFNAYGATETTVDSTVFEATAGGLPGSVFVPVGRPLANTAIYVLDRRRQLVPAGVTGEIYVGGPGVAQGYYGRPDLTAERFLPDPFLPGSGARMYRTGDVGRWLADRGLEFRGRADDQIKILGFRVEPGWVESVLAKHPAVAAVAVAPWQSQSGHTRLAGYVAPVPGASVNPLEVRRFLAGRLPAYAIPAIIMAVDELPLTPSGKVDRRALPAPRAVPESRMASGPRTAAETVLAGIWAEVLEVEVGNLSAGDNFFDLGGDSILSIRVTSRIQASLGISFSVRQLFDTPTLGELARLVEVEEAADERSAVISPADRSGPLPLSYTQQRLWFLYNFDPDSAEYNTAVALRLSGHLDVTALQTALDGLVARHEALRTTFDTTAGAGIAAVHPPAPVTLTRLAVPDDESADRCLGGLISQPFDLRTGPVYRAALAEVGGTHWVLALIIHHIATDGWSMGLLTRELGELYAAARIGARPDLAPLPIQYADFAVWQRGHLTDARLSAHLDYWRKQLHGIMPLQLPIDRPRPQVRDAAGAVRFTELGAEILSDLHELARRNDATLFMALVASVQLLLARYTGQEDIVVGTASSGRNRPELERIAGFFVNTIPLRSAVDVSQSFEDFVLGVRDTVLEAFVHEDVPFERMVDAVQAGRDTSRNPVVEVMVALEGVPPSPVELPGVSAEELPLVSDQVSYDLDLTFIERDGKLMLAVGYSRSLFDAATIEQMTGHLSGLLRAVCAEPARRLSEVSMLAPQEKQRLLGAYRAAPARAFASPALASAAALAPAVRCLHELFTEQAQRSPDAIALVHEDVALTYAELEERSNRLAHYLVRRGVRPDELVGVCAGRGLELVVALLAVTKAGGGYVPLDPGYPSDRLEVMIADSGVRLAVAGPGLAASLPDRLEVVDLGGDQQMIAAEPGTPPAVLTTPDNLAYVIYTSGSTGRPKAVCVSHRNVIRLLSATDEAYGFTASDVWTLFHAYAFDVSVWELWGALLHGGRLVVVGWEVSRAPRDLLQLLARQQVTVLSQTPSTFYQFIQADSDAQELSAWLRLRYVILAGEALDFSRLDGWFARHGYAAPSLVNMYGITETTVHSTVLKLSEPAVRGATGSGVGHPIADLRCYLLDQNLQPVPPGVPGEIYVSGPGLARGYLGQPGLTASRFVADSASGTGGRMYRSGDFARSSPDGTLEYLGRADQQVKLHGYRVELGEIESALCRHPAVAQALAAVHDDRLIACVTAAGQQSPGAAELRSFLASSLPGYAVPAIVVTLDRIPLTRNGKPDRPALAEVQQPAMENPSQARPRNEMESLLTGIWAGTLGLSAAEIGIHDSFFDLGGDSILGIQLVFNARRAGLAFSARDILLHQTVAELAPLVGRDESAAPVKAQVAGPVPLTPIQYWFFENHPVAPHHITQSVLAELAADTDRGALDAALSALSARHDALRLRYRRGPDGWQQHCTDAEPAQLLHRHDLSGLTDDAGRQAAMARLAAQADASLDLSSGPLLKALLFDFGDGAAPWLFITAHHLIIDAVSWRILLQDLSDGHQQAASGAPVSLGPVTTSFASWAGLLAAQAAGGELDDELSYWRSLPAAEPLPVSGAGPGTVASVRSVSVSLTPEETAVLLRRSPPVYRAGVSHVLLSALARAVSQWTGHQTVLVDLEGHGREEITDAIDLSQTVGCFTSIYPVALTVDKAADWPAMIRGVRDTLRAIPGHGLGYGSLRYLTPGSELADRRRPEILFNYHSQTDAVTDSADGPLYHAFHEPIGQDRDPAEQCDHPLEIVVVIRNGSLEADWYYSASVHDEEVITQVAGNFRQALSEIACQLGHGTRPPAAK